MTKFIPTEDRVLIDPTPIEQETESGLILVKSETDSTPTTGRVIAMGPGRLCQRELPPPKMDDDRDFVYAPFDFKIGDRVQWSKFSGTQLEFSGKTYLLMRAGDIIGVIPDGK